MTDDNQKTGGKAFIIDEAGDIAWGSPEECRSSKVEAVKARQDAFGNDGTFTVLSGDALKAAIREALMS